MEAWRARPLDSVYPVVLIDALYVRSAKVRWPTAGSTWHWASTATANATCSGCGREPCNAWCAWSAPHCVTRPWRTGTGPPRICGRSRPPRPRPPPNSGSPSSKPKGATDRYPGEGGVGRTGPWPFTLPRLRGLGASLFEAALFGAVWLVRAAGVSAYGSACFDGALITSRSAAISWVAEQGGVCVVSSVLKVI